MGWFWGFGKKDDEEDIKEVTVDSISGGKVDVEVTDPKPGKFFFWGRIKDPQVKHLDDDGEWVDGSAKEYRFRKDKARKRRR